MNCNLLKNKNKKMLIFTKKFAILLKQNSEISTVLICLIIYF